MKPKILLPILTIIVCLLSAQTFAISDVKFCKSLFKLSENSRNTIYKSVAIAEAEVYGRQKIIYFTAISEKQTFHPESLIPDHSPNDLYIGFSKGHTYLVFNGYRYDGSLMPVHIATIKNVQVLESGVIFRISDIPKDIAINITNYLAGHTTTVNFSFTCSAGICSVLDKNGMTIKGFENFIPSFMLKNLLTNGVTTPTGQKLQIQLYLVNHKNINKFITQSIMAETILSICSGFLTITIPSGIIGLIIGLLALLLAYWPYYWLIGLIIGLLALLLAYWPYYWLIGLIIGLLALLQ